MPSSVAQRRLSPSAFRLSILRHATPQAHGARADFYYPTNYPIDVDNAVIVDVDSEMTTVMLDRIARHCGIVETGNDSWRGRHRTDRGTPAGT
jgi:IstB-like ATP binding protein